MKIHLKEIIHLIRPHQWIKNLLLFFPAFFAGSLLEAEVFFKMVPAVAAFCAAASCSYIINDIRDAESDRQHETKKDRAIACGLVTAPVALLLATVLCLAAFLISTLVSDLFWIYILIYLAVSLSYTFYFKAHAILDVFIISSAFLVRVMAGGEASNINASSWLLMSVFMVSLFLAAGKRRGEMALMGECAGNHRQSLNHYSTPFLEGVLWFTASSALVTYALYTLEHASVLFYTVPVAAFGLLRYIYIVQQGKGDPTEALLKDGQIMATGIIWASMIGLVIYG